MYAIWYRYSSGADAQPTDARAALHPSRWRDRYPAEHFLRRFVLGLVRGTPGSRVGLYGPGFHVVGPRGLWELEIREV